MNVQRKVQHAVEHVPFVGIIVIALIVTANFFAFSAILGIVLRYAEITSVYNRILPDAQLWHYVVSAFVAMHVSHMLSKGIPDYPVRRYSMINPEEWAAPVHSGNL